LDVEGVAYRTERSIRMVLRVAREGAHARFRFTLGEMLLGIVLHAIPLGYWASNVQGFHHRHLSVSSGKTLAAKSWMALSIQTDHAAKNSNSILAHKITTYVILAFNALLFAMF
jgi:hypothetical protein